jgi:hypothetical protein
MYATICFFHKTYAFELVSCKRQRNIASSFVYSFKLPNLYTYFLICHPCWLIIISDVCRYYHLVLYPGVCACFKLHWTYSDTNYALYCKSITRILRLDIWVFRFCPLWLTISVSSLYLWMVAVEYYCMVSSWNQTIRLQYS